MADVQKRFVKLTLYPVDDADVIAMIDKLARCGRLSQTVIAALRAYSAGPVLHQQAQGEVFEPLADVAPMPSAKPQAVDESVFSFQ